MDKKYQDFLKQESKKEKYSQLKQQRDKAWDNYKKIDNEMEKIAPKKVQTFGDPSVNIIE